MSVPTAPRAVAPTVATPAPTTVMLVVSTSSHTTMVSRARGIGCLTTHPLPDSLRLLSGIVNLAPEVPYLLLKLPPFVGDVI